MKIDILETKLTEVKKQYAMNAFLDGSRLSSTLADVSEDVQLSEEIVLLKALYRLAGPDMIGLVKSLNKGDAEIEANIARIQQITADAFLVRTEVSALLGCIVKAFEVNPPEVLYEQKNQLITIKIEELAKALADLDDKYKDDLWREGNILVSLISDQAPELVNERKLLSCIYEAAGTEVKRLIRAVVRREDEEPYVIKLQQKLKAAYFDDYYIDAFFYTVLDKLFGCPYQTPLIKTFNVQAVSVSKPNTPSLAQRKPQPPNTQNKQQVSKKKHSNRFFKLIIYVVLLFVVIKQGPKIKDFVIQRVSDAESVSNTESSDSIDVSEETQGKVDDNTVSEEIYEKFLEEETEVQELYHPVVTSDVWIDSVDTTVYGENLTDLHNYALYEVPRDLHFSKTGTGMAYEFAYPTNLYTKVVYNEETHAYEFSGDDGSTLGYYRLADDSLHKYTGSEIREMILNGSTLAEFEEVEMLSINDSETETSFYITAKDGDLNVVYICTFYTNKSQGLYMLLRYPDPKDETEKLIQDYYIECLYVLNKFTDSEKNDYFLRSYEDYLNE